MSLWRLAFFYLNFLITKLYSYFSAFSKYILCISQQCLKCYSLCRAKVPSTNSQQSFQLGISVESQKGWLVSSRSTWLHSILVKVTSAHSLALQAIEGLVQGLVIPLVGNQLIVAVDDGEGIDQGGAQEGVHILGHVFPITRSVLGPVGEVAHHLGGRACGNCTMSLCAYCHTLCQFMENQQIVDVLWFTQMAYQQTNAYGMWKTKSLRNKKVTLC